jgi:nucleoside-diphosphate-sugar epimerase
LGLVARGVPLPFGAIRNQRSLVYVGNLADVLALAATHPAAPGKTYLVSDGEDVSTPELVARIAGALGRRPRLVDVPPSLLRAGAGLLGKAAAANRLLGSLAVDSSPVRAELGWRPAFSLDDGLAETARWFLARP